MRAVEAASTMASRGISVRSACPVVAIHSMQRHIATGTLKHKAMKGTTIIGRTCRSISLAEQLGFLRGMRGNYETHYPQGFKPGERSP